MKNNKYKVIKPDGTEWTYSSFEWNAVWILVWLSGIVVGVVIF